MFDKSPSELCSKVLKTFNSLSFTRIFSGIASIVLFLLILLIYFFTLGFSNSLSENFPIVDHVVYKLDTISCKTEWTLKDFKSYSGLLGYAGPIQLIGEQFRISKFPNVAWELCIEIGMKSWNVKGSNSIWLRQIGPNGIDNLVNTKYKIYAIKDDGARVDIARSSNKLENKAKLGYSIVNLNNLFHSDGSLYLHCEVEIDYYNSDENIKNNYYKMLEEKAFTDCVIKVDKKVIKVHRSVLAINSKVFLSILKQKNGSTEAENCEIIISDFSFECVQAMLEFFYTGGIEKKALEDHVEEIFVIGHKYQLKQLVYECELFMSNLIYSGNMLKYFKMIKLYGAPVLEKGCKNYIQVNKESFLKSKKWEEIERTYPQLSLQILKAALHEL